MLLTSFIARPAPLPPTCNIRAANVSSAGRARSMAAPSPPMSLRMKQVSSVSMPSGALAGRARTDAIAPSWKQPRPTLPGRLHQTTPAPGVVSRTRAPRNPQLRWCATRASPLGQARFNSFSSPVPSPGILYLAVHYRSPVFSRQRR